MVFWKFPIIEQLLIQTSCVTVLIVICDKFEYNVVYSPSYLFVKCFRSVKGIIEFRSFLSKVVKKYIYIFSFVSIHVARLIRFDVVLTIHRISEPIAA